VWGFNPSKMLQMYCTYLFGQLLCKLCKNFTLTIAFNWSSHWCSPSRYSWCWQEDVDNTKT
jgi:hypothetical protein